jgi:PAS domain S-box-containing protein
MADQRIYESILESISGGFFALDESLYIRYWNNAAEKGTGLPSGEVIGRHVFDVFPNAKDAELGEKYRTALATRTYQSIETAYKDHRFEAWYDVRIYPSATGLSVFFQDITEKKREQRQKELLVEITRAINGSRHLDELCMRAGERIALLLGIPSSMVAVFLFDPRGNEIRLVAPALIDVEFPHDVVHQNVTAECDRPAARAALTRQIQISGDLAMSTVAPSMPAEAQAHDLKTVIAIPLEVQGDVQGVLEVLSMKSADFTADEVALLSTAAADLANGMSRKRLIDELRAKNLELEAQTQKTLEASDTLKKFLATFSHELRSPLNSIIGFSDLLTGQTDNLPPETVREFMKNINGSGRHLQQIINDILDLSKIESGTLDLHIATYPVSYFEESVRRVLSASIAQKNIELVFTVPPDFENLVVDQTRFKQILINLVSNAVKFSHPAGRVEIQFERVGNDLLFSVRDDGIGIRVDEQAALFRPFKQAAGGKEMNREGIGLGLAITKKLIELHQGSIWVESVWGQGTTFWFKIPMMVDAANERAAQAGMMLETLEREHRLRDLGEKPLALIVEDSPQASELLRLYIESAGYRTAVAPNGADAVELAKRLQPNVITLDVMLPVKDGWQVLKDLKRHPLCKHIPVIIVSIADEKNLGFSLGAVDYFVKPVNKSDLVHALDRVHIIRKTGDRKPTVLVIDDDRAATDLVQVILENEGFRVLKSYDGHTGVELAVRERPDVILLDLVMPETSGFSVAHQLKQIPATRGIPIIVLTSLEVDEDAMQQLGEYVNGLMSKSAFTKRDLLREIGNIENTRYR